MPTEMHQHIRWCWYPVLIRILLAVLFVLAWTGCSSPGRPVIVEGSPAREPASAPQARSSPATPRSQERTHVVQRGDTLYAIARLYSADLRTLARSNGLKPPYTIYPGQKLKVRSGRSVARAAPPVVRPVPPPTVGSNSGRRSGSSTSSAGKLRTPSSALNWRWPTSSRVVRGFDGTNKGLDFELRPGSSIKAAAQGEVVYAGSGLGGYERLVILKHNDTFLSAYSLNHPYAVREGQRLKTGDRIARMGNGSAKSRTMHFEIRRNGDPVDPRRLLRKR